MLAFGSLMTCKEVRYMNACMPRDCITHPCTYSCIYETEQTNGKTEVKIC